MENFEKIPSFPDAETPDAIPQPPVTLRKPPPESAETPQTSQTPEVTETPQASQIPESAEVTQTPQTPEGAEVPQTPQASEVPQTPQISESAEVTQSPQASQGAEVPQSPQASQGAEVPQSPQAPQGAEVPQTLQAPEVTETPQASQTSESVSASEPSPETAQVSPAPSARPRRARNARKKRSLRWFWGFLCGVAVAGLLAVGARLWEQRRAPAVDRFIWDFRETEQTVNPDFGIHIDTWPIGEGPAFTLLREHGDTLSAQEIYRNVNPTVVTVIVELNDNTAAVGTGVIFSPDGYFVTNYHVIQGGVKCRAMLDSGRSYPALFVAGDERNDLAVLKMDASDTLPAAQFGDSELLSVGDDVYAIGNPLGIEFRGTLTNGIISAIDRDVLVDGRTMNLLQTNAALNSGNSGGPLINQYGQVVGINVVKMSSRRSTVEGLGFAIPSASMERLINDLLTYGKSQPEPVIGVSVDSFGTEVAPDVWGIGVMKVEIDSAAEKAGIQVGDYIIAADNETVSNSRDLLRVRRRFHVGDSMSLTLWRNGERVETVLTFTETW